MPGAANTATVDGVEPSILVNLLDIADNPDKVKIFTDDSGTERWLTREGDPVLVTNKDLVALGSFGIEILGNETSSAANQAQDTQAQDTIVKLPPLNVPTPPGQSG